MAAAVGMIIALGVGCDKDLTKDEPDFSSNLVHYFPFSGSANDDVTGEEFGLYNVGFLTDRKAKVESSAFFNGINGWMDINANLKDKEGTLSFWIFPCLCKEYNPLFVKKAPENDPFFGQYYVGYSEAGKIETSCRGKWNVETGVEVTANKWHHLVIRWDDSSGLVDIFVNGKKVLSAEYSVDPSALPDDTTPGFLGKTVNKSEESGDIKTVYYKGKLDEIRMYNKWLPYSEIKALYNE